MKLSPHASRKLWDILSHAEIQHQLNGADLAELLKRKANREHGQTKKLLLQIASFGNPGTSEWIDRFIQWMNAKQDSS